MVGRYLQIQGILGCNDIDLVPHEPSEKGYQVPLRATDLAHTADINSLDISRLCLAHHPAVSRAAQPTVVNVISPANHFGTIALRLQHQNIQGVFRFYVVAGDARIQPCALGFLCCLHGFLFPLFCFVFLAITSNLPLSVMLSQVESVSSLSPYSAEMPVSYSARALQADT